MQYPSSLYVPSTPLSSRAGAWFHDLDRDLDSELARLICEVSDVALLHDGQVVLDARTSGEPLFGCPAEALVGKAISDLVARAPEQALSHGAERESGGGAWVAVGVDGARVNVRASEAPPVWCRGQAARLLALRALPPRTGMRSEVVPAFGAGGPHSTPLSASDVLGVAHDLNSMLTTMTTGLELLERGMNETIRGCAVEACRRAAVLVAELVAMGRGAEQSCHLTGLGDSIRRAVSLATQGTGVDVQLAIDDDLWPAYVHASKLERLIFNLALNAVQAMPGGGSLTVTASNTYVHQPSRTGVLSGRAVRVSVADTGPGIPSAAMSRIFEPYYTTKARGMGIGLAACRALVLEARGDITVESKAGAGTTFHVYLPPGVHSEPPPAPRSAASQP